MASTTTRPPRPGRFLPREQNVVEPYRLTPRLALRVAVLGGLVALVFAVLFLRLWALQVLAGTKYVDQARSISSRTVPIQAARGVILDRNGNVLVTNAATTAVELWPADLPKTYVDRYNELRALARVTHVPLYEIAAAIKSHQGDPVTPVVIRQSARNSLVNYLAEHAAQFPGVETPPTYVRAYPYRALAAQVLGYVGEVSSEQLKTLSKKGYKPGDVIGQAGVESSYDTYLRGVAGAAKMNVDSLGRPRSQLQQTVISKPGHALRLTLDLKLQEAAQNALAYGIHLAQADGQWAARGGAIVALNPNDGSILAHGLVAELRAVRLRRTRHGEGAEQPGADGEDRGGEELSVAEPRAPGDVSAGVGLQARDGARRDAGAHRVAVRDAAVHRDVHGSRGQVAPHVPQLGPEREPADGPADGARVLVRHVLLPTGQRLLPTAERPRPAAPEVGEDLRLRPGHRNGRGARGAGTRADDRVAAPALHARRPTRPCWQVDRLWKPGNSIQLAIGQGDLLVTPLQMARFYALIANGGKLVTPHVLMDVENPNGTAVPVPALPAPQQVPGLDPAALQVVRQGLFEGTHMPFGTSYAVFGQFPVSIAGKTGTAEKVVSLPGYLGVQNQSWWCGYGPTNSAKIVVCAVIENGGHGGTAAAPAAERVFSKFFHVNAHQLGPIHSD